MAKKKTTTKKAEKAPIENKAEKAKPEVKYNGYISIGGTTVRMSEAKARLLVKQGRAKFA